MDLYDSLPLEKALTFRIVRILIKSVFNKDRNNNYCNIFLEKCSYKWYKMLYWDRIDVSEKLIVIKQVHQKSLIFVIIGIF